MLSSAANESSEQSWCPDGDMSRLRTHHAAFSPRNRVENMPFQSHIAPHITRDDCSRSATIFQDKLDAENDDSDLIKRSHKIRHNIVEIF
jgi:hypothetical protein